MTLRGAEILDGCFDEALDLVELGYVGNITVRGASKGLDFFDCPRDKSFDELLLLTLF
jgi:hypothetical protein